MPLLTHTERLGTCLGDKYRVDAILAQGGMGVLFCARRLADGLDVAIKLPRLELTTEITRARRLEREGHLLAQLAHRNLVTMLDAGLTSDGLPYVVLERLHGRSLAVELRDKGPLSPEDTLAHILPIAGALATVHQQGFVHRDLKPDNIYLHRDSTDKVVPKLLDFGLTRSIAALESDSTLDTGMTETGMVAGTPQYMAPERAAGQSQTDPRSDLWSLTAVVHRCLTGQAVTSPRPQPPYDNPCTLEAWPNLPLADALRRGLCADPDGRYATVDAWVQGFVASALDGGFTLPTDPDPQGLPSYRRFVDTMLEERTLTGQCPRLPDQPAKSTHATPTDDRSRPKATSKATSKPTSKTTKTTKTPAHPRVDAAGAPPRKPPRPPRPSSADPNTRPPPPFTVAASLTALGLLALVALSTPVNDSVPQARRPHPPGAATDHRRPPHLPPPPTSHHTTPAPPKPSPAPRTPHGSTAPPAPWPRTTIPSSPNRTPLPSTQLPSTQLPGTKLPSTKLPSTKLPSTKPAPSQPKAGPVRHSGPARTQPDTRRNKQVRSGPPVPRSEAAAKAHPPPRSRSGIPSTAHAPPTRGPEEGDDPQPPNLRHNPQRPLRDGHRAAHPEPVRAVGAEPQPPDSPGILQPEPGSTAQPQHTRPPPSAPARAMERNAAAQQLLKAATAPDAGLPMTGFEWLPALRTEW